MDGVGHQQTLVTKFDLAGKVVPAIDIYFLACCYLTKILVKNHFVQHLGKYRMQPFFSFFGLT